MAYNTDHDFYIPGASEIIKCKAGRLGGGIVWPLRIEGPIKTLKRNFTANLFIASQDSSNNTALG